MITLTLRKRQSDGIRLTVREGGLRTSTAYEPPAPTVTSYGAPVPQAAQLPAQKPVNGVSGVGNTAIPPAQKTPSGAAQSAFDKWSVGRNADKEIGQRGVGNIDLYNRPQYRNSDGSVSTVRSMSFNSDGYEILVPTIAFDNRGKAVELSDDEAIDRYYRTGEYLGKFRTVEEADAYAQKLHEAQEYYYSGGRTADAAKKTANRAVAVLPSTDNAESFVKGLNAASEYQNSYADNSAQQRLASDMAKWAEASTKRNNLKTGMRFRSLADPVSIDNGVKPTAQDKAWYQTMTNAEKRHAYKITDAEELGKYINSLDLNARAVQQRKDALAKTAKELEVKQLRKTKSVTGQAIAAQIESGLEAPRYSYAAQHLDEYTGGFYSELRFLTDRQRETIQKFAKAGDYQAIEDYYNAIKGTLNQGERQEIETNYKQFGKEHPVVSVVPEGVLNSVNGIPAIAQGVYNKARESFTGEWTPVDYNSHVYDMVAASQAIQEGASERIMGTVDPNTGQRVGGIQNDALRSLANTARQGTSSAITNGIQLLTGAALGFGGGALSNFTIGVMGSSAAGQQYHREIKAGKSQSEALANAIATGVIESLTEKVSVDRFIKQAPMLTGKNGKELFTSWLRMSAIQGGIEGVEEITGNVADQLWDIYYSGTNSEYSKRTQAILAAKIGEGINRTGNQDYAPTDDEINAARQQAFTELFVQQSAEAFASAVFSSFLLAGAPAAYNGINNVRGGQRLLNLDRQRPSDYIVRNEIEKGKLTGRQNALVAKQALEVAEELENKATNTNGDFNIKKVSPAMLGHLARLNDLAISETLQNMANSDNADVRAEAFTRLSDLKKLSNENFKYGQLEELYEVARTNSTAPLSSPFASEEAKEAEAQQRQTQTDNPTSPVLTATEQKVKNAFPNITNLKTIRNRAAIIDSIINGEDVGMAQFKAIDPTDAKTKSLFKNLTGVQIPDGLSLSRELYQEYQKGNRRLQTAVVEAERATLAQEEAERAQQEAQDIPPAPDVAPVTQAQPATAPADVGPFASPAENDSASAVDVSPDSQLDVSLAMDNPDGRNPTLTQSVDAGEVGDAGNATGAASRGFTDTGSDFIEARKLGDTFGSIKEDETDAASVRNGVYFNIPASDGTLDETGNISKVGQNAATQAASRNAGFSVVEDILHSVLNGEYNIKSSTTLKGAAKQAEFDMRRLGGVQKSRDHLMEIAKSGRLFNPDEIALSQRVLVNLFAMREQGKISRDDYIDFSVTVHENLSAYGQGLGFARLLNRLDPDFAIIEAERAVDKINEKAKKINEAKTSSKARGAVEKAVEKIRKEVLEEMTDPKKATEETLRRMFEEKKLPAKSQKELDRIFKKFSDLANMGAFTDENYREKAAAAVFGYDYVTIDQNLIQEFRDAKNDEERDAAIGKIQQNVADQIHATLGEKFTALQYIGMLGSFKTIFSRNLSGNLIFQPAIKLKNSIAAQMETFAYNKGWIEEKTRSAGAVNKEDVAAFKDDFKNNKAVRTAIMNGDKYMDSSSSPFMQGVQERRKILNSGNDFLSRTVGNALEFTRVTLIGGTMEWGDAVFAGHTYAVTAARYLKAQGVTFSTATQEQLDRAREVAIREASEATYRDNSVLAQAFAKARYHGQYAGINPAKHTFYSFANAIGQGVLPFRKTPANIVVRSFEYSPFGLTKGVVDTLARRKGVSNMTGNDVINELAKGLSGTALFLLGLIFRKIGLITGKGKTGKEKEFDDLRGIQQYSFRWPIGKTPRYFDLSFAAPEAIPVFLGANFCDTLGTIVNARQDGEFDGEDIGNIFFSVAKTVGAGFDPVFEMSMLSGVDDALKNAAAFNNDSSAIVYLIANSFVSYFTQAASPQILSQAVRASNNNRQMTFVNRGSSTPTKIQRIIGNIPYLSLLADNKMDYIDQWGRTRTNYDLAVSNAVAQFVSPTYQSVYEPYAGTALDSEAVDNALYDLYLRTGEKSVLPSGANAYFQVNKERKNLTKAEYIQYASAKGNTALGVLQELVKTDAFTRSESEGGLSDAQKIAAVQWVYAYANECAKAVATGYDDWTEEATEDQYSPSESYRNAAKLDESGKVPIAVYAAAYGAQNTVKESIQWESGKNKGDAVETTVRYTPKGKSKPVERTVGSKSIEKALNIRKALRLTGSDAQSQYNELFDSFQVAEAVWKRQEGALESDLQKIQTKKGGATP